jgi:Spy/CpxP family protein refolding chaperone
MSRLLFAALLAVAVFFSANPLYAGDMMPPMSGGPGGDIAFMTMPPMAGSCPTPEFFLEQRDELGLSDAQVSDIRKLDFDLTKRKILKGARVKALELELSEIVTGRDFAEDKALDKLSEIEKARTELRTEVVKAYGKLRGLLDSGQIDTLNRLLEAMPVTGHRMRAEKASLPQGIDKDRIKERMMKQMMEKGMP